MIIKCKSPSELERLAFSGNLLFSKPFSFALMKSFGILKLDVYLIVVCFFFLHNVRYIFYIMCVIFFTLMCVNNSYIYMGPAAYDIYIINFYTPILQGCDAFQDREANSILMHVNACIVFNIVFLQSYYITCPERDHVEI